MSGFLPSYQRHVVALELLGPRSKEQYESFRDEVEALAARYNANIIVRARGKKEIVNRKKAGGRGKKK